MKNTAVGANWYCESKNNYQPIIPLNLDCVQQLLTIANGGFRCSHLNKKVDTQSVELTL